MSRRYPLVAIGELEAKGAIVGIQDGNHGERHPKIADYVEDGIPFIMAKDIGSGFIEFDSCSRISEDQARRLRIGFSINGDVLLSHKGTVGSVALVSGVDSFVMLTPQVTYYRTDNSVLLNRFVAYAFRDPGFQARLHAIGGQGTRAYIGITAQRRLEIVVPPFPTQARIVDVLAPYDELIDNNRRRMELLEEAARQLFREWFVRLRFPGYEHVRMTNGMPEGWRKIQLDKITTKIGSGFTPRGGESAYISGGIPLIRSLNVYDDSFRSEGLVFVNEEHAAALAGVAVESRDILLNITGASVARCCMAPERYLPARVNQHVMIIRVDPGKADPFFVHRAINSDEKKRQLLSYAQKGATREALTKEMVAGFEVMLPPERLMRQFGEIAAVLFQQREILAHQNQKLRIARDLLLPHLMDGKIQV